MADSLEMFLILRIKFSVETYGTCLMLTHLRLPEMLQLREGIQGFFLASEIEKHNCRKYKT